MHIKVSEYKLLLHKYSSEKRKKLYVIQFSSPYELFLNYIEYEKTMQSLLVIALSLT
jgi:hypothetical protein